MPSTVKVLYMVTALITAAAALHAQAAPIEKQIPVETGEPADNPAVEAQPTPKPATDARIDPMPPAEPTAEELAKRREAEAAERAAKLEAARVAEQRRIEAERTWFDKLVFNSKLYTGVNAGLVVPLNSVHGTGYGVGMTLDYLAYQRYGFHFGAETGMLPAKAGNLPAGAASITISDKGTFGYLNLRFAGLYAFPKFMDLETAAGLGVSVYQLNGGTHDFNTAIAPVALGTAYYNLLPGLQAGLIAQAVFPSASRIISASTEYTLDSRQSLATVSMHASVRYSWF